MGGLPHSVLQTGCCLPQTGQGTT